MRIAIDLQGLQSDGSRTRGIGRYSYSFIYNLVELYPQNQYILVANAALKNLKNEFDTLLKKSNVIYYEWFSPCPLDFISNDLNKHKLGLYLRSFAISCLSADIFIITSFFEGFIDNCLIEYDQTLLKTKVVSIFYDLIPLLNSKLYLDGNPEFSKFYRNKILNLKKVDALLSISNSSAKEAIEYLSFENDKVFNISSACDSHLFSSIVDRNDNSSSRKINRNYEFVLYAGAYDPRKNIKNLLHAYSLLPEKLSLKYKLVLAGKIAPSERELIDIWISNYKIDHNNVVIYGYISDKDLVLLYKECTLFIFPSFHEGFGLPILEAMHCGAPVIGSNCTSVSEVIDDKQAMFDPRDVISIRNLIEKALIDQDFLSFLRENSAVQKEKFSWPNTAKSAFSALQTILKDDYYENEKLSWESLIKQNKEKTTLLLSYIQSNTSLSKKDDEDMSKLIGVCIDKILTQSDSISRFFTKGKSITSWQVQGPVDSNYSLAILNRCFSEAMSNVVDDFTIHITEGPGDYEPNFDYIKQYPKLNHIYNNSLNPITNSEVVSRNLYPPRVSDMNSKFNILHSYGWEESEFPLEWVHEFNSYLQGISVMSSQVKKILIDNGVTIPIQITGLGLDHIDEIVPSKNFSFSSNKYKILHVSSCFPRKGLDILLKAYESVFSINDDVILIIKTFSNPHNDIENNLHKLKKNNPLFPKVKLIYDDLTDQDLKALYLQSDLLIAPSRSEGFGLPIAEAMKLGIPVITTAWGGQMDFCNHQNCWLIDFKYVLSKSHFNLDFSCWAEPSFVHLGELIKEVYSLNDEEVSKKTRVAMSTVEKMTWNKVVLNNKKFVEEKVIPYNYHLMKLGCISTFNSRCGIASYTNHLLEFIPGKIFLFTPLSESPVNNTNNDYEIIPSWNLDSKAEDFSLLIEKINSLNITSLIIQFNFSFFDFDGFQNLVSFLHQKQINIIIIMHSTISPITNESKKIEKLINCFQLCDRILVHTIHDLNRLKDKGLIDNVTLFPHGILDFLPSKRNNSRLNRLLRFRNKIRIASYGFCLPNKGFEQLILAIDLLRKQNVNIKLDIYSAIYSESYQYFYDELIELIHKYELENFITINKEYMTDRETLKNLSRYNFLVFPYQKSSESSSASVRHGLATGKPVLVTPSSIFSDLKGLVEVFDGFSPESIAKGIYDWILKTNDDTNYQSDVFKERNNIISNRSFSTVSNRLYRIIQSIETNKCKGN